MAFRARNVFGTFEKWAPGTGLVKVLNLNDAIKDVQQQIKQEYKRFHNGGNKHQLKLSFSFIFV